METLIILFILYSIFQFFFGDNKKKEEERRKQRRQKAESAAAETGTATASKKEPESWQDVMKELESIFSGDPAETEEQKRARREAEFKRPEPQSIQQHKGSQTQRQRPYETSSRYGSFEEEHRPGQKENPAESENTALARAKRGEDLNMGNEPGISELAADEDNPIFGGANTDTDDPRKGSVSKAAATSLINRIKDPSSASQAIIMKEILDKPMARRRTARHSF